MHLTLTSSVQSGGRLFTRGNVRGYRFGFNGQMKDDELHGEGNTYAFEYRIHDARIGRFLSVDPLAPEYPWNSTYAFAENDVIRAIDIEGLEIFFTHSGELIGKYGTSTEIYIVNKGVPLLYARQAIIQANSGNGNQSLAVDMINKHSRSTGVDYEMYRKHRGHNGGGFQIKNGNLYYGGYNSMSSFNGRGSGFQAGAGANTENGALEGNVDAFTANAENHTGTGAYPLAFDAEASVAAIDANGQASVNTSNGNFGIGMDAEGSVFKADAMVTQGVLTGEDNKNGITPV